MIFCCFFFFVNDTATTEIYTLSLHDALPISSLEEQIAGMVAAVSSGMRRDVTRLGDRLRNPTVMSDPWMLIQDLLEFRGRVRAATGELIYQVCSLVSEVERKDV